MKKVVKKLIGNGRLEIDGNMEIGYTVKEFRNGELYMETEFDDSDSAVAEAVCILKQNTEREENGFQEREERAKMRRAP